jgi:gamma-secretase subunit APH-1
VAFFKSKAEKGLLKVQQAEHKKLIFDRRVIAYVSGLGFGLISGAFSLVNVLNDMTGPGTIGINGHTESFFIVSCKSLNNSLSLFIYLF